MNVRASIRQADRAAVKEDHIVARGGVLAPAPHPATAAAPGDAELEHAGILEKEIPLLRKKQAETAQVDLLLVGFDLREVGVHREVPRQPARHTVFDVEADIAIPQTRLSRPSLAICASALAPEGLIENT